MADQPNDNRPHLFPKGTAETKAFTAHSGRKTKVFPDLPRAQHGGALQHQLQQLRPVAEAAAVEQKEMEVQSGLGLRIEFEGQPDVELAIESLANDPKKIELLSVRHEADRTFANVFVPDGKLAHFEKYVLEYLQEKKDKKGRARDHKALLNTIAAIRAAGIEALWTDTTDQLPQDPAEQFWWEVWLPTRQSRDDVVSDFRKLATLAGCVVTDSQANFPERTVLLMYGSRQQLAASALTLNCVAELRRAKETAEFFAGMARPEQQEWLDNLVARTQHVGVTEDVPRICLLDSGVNRGHPLLTQLLDPADLHTVNPAWGVDDQANHGTGQAGLAAYGDLTEALALDSAIPLGHRLESVKLTPNDGANQGDAKHHAYLFAEAVSRPEIAAPDRPRLFASAVTASDYRDRGRPSSWSAAVDRLASDADGDGAFPRLFVLSAGNTREHDAWVTYPASLSTNLIHDPGQAWNALTVGACTSKVHIVEPDAQGYQPIAAEEALSPFTTTSAAWDRAWPMKPDVVFEGGNLGKDAIGAIRISSLDLLTTHFQPVQRLFTTSNATSAASALCAQMAAQLMSAYPALKPETIRALIVHSAEWSEAMKAMYLPAEGNITKNDFVNLVRHCGWGRPNLSTALWSAGNSLCLVVEDEVYPYKKTKSGVRTRDMHLHSLPWPKEELEILQDAKVELRVTLSYFVEPNPSDRGGTSKFHYPSHRLRFDIRRPLESLADFVARINAAAAREDEGEEGNLNPKDPNWCLGERLRHRGSLHRDMWEGTAAELASRGYLAVYPAMGWWRTRPRLERYGLPARYSLVVSIHTEQTQIDLYNAVEQQMAVEIPVEGD